MILFVIRMAVFALFVLSAGVAVSSWALRTQRLNPFGATGRLVRKTTDPVLAPIETWLLRRGGNPQNAGWWLLGIALVGGIVAITTAEWLAALLLRMSGAAAAGPRSLLRLAIYLAGQLVVIALIVRVIGSWFGIGRFNRWMRPAYVLTDWIVQPLRRVIPPIGMIDVTPIVAWFLIQFVALPLILSVL